MLYFSAAVMRTERLLGGFETLVLLAVIRLDGLAYGVTLREELKKHAGKDVAGGAIYTGLDRLGQKGFVESWTGDPTLERGGRAKRFYRVTASGVRAIKDNPGCDSEAIKRLETGETDMEYVTPPRAALVLLNVLASEPDLAHVVGDLSEELQKRVSSSGYATAKLWYWRETFRSCNGLGKA
jgi:DNA-binding PadR family transcriptional regulator